MELKTLGNIVNRKIGYGVVQPGSPVLGGVPIVKVKDIISGLKSPKDLDTADPSIESRYLRSRLRGGELLVSVVGTTGKTAIVPYSFEGCNVARAVAVVDIPDALETLWIKYYIDSPQGQEYISRELNTTVQPTLNIKSLVNMPIPFPKSEQMEKTVSILNLIDSKIALNNKINQNLLQQAETLFKERFLKHATLPLGWKRMALGDISDMSAGGDKPKNISDKKTEEHLYPIYSNGISDEGLYGFTSDYKISEESVTVSARGTIGFVCLRHVPFTPVVRLVTLVPHTNIVSAKYLYLWLKSIPIHGTGTTQQQLTVPDFRKTEIVIPLETDMKDFTETIDPLFRNVWSNQEENAKLSEVRDSLLPRLISGELDVSDLGL